jgi:hypothetical protein
MCVCISESGRNKTQLAGKKDSLRGGKNTLAKLASKFEKLLANSKFHSHLASWRVVISTPDVSLLSPFWEVLGAITQDFFVRARARVRVCVCVCV